MPAATNNIQDVSDLEERLSRPPQEAVNALANLTGDILILGAGGKMGPTLARMAKRASDATGNRRRVVAVSRFGDPATESQLNACGVETIRCDLLVPAQLELLPDSPNIVYMAGMKFGATDNPALTWAMNVMVPAMVCRRYPAARFTVFSTGNVYPLIAAESGGSQETDLPNPSAEYGMSCVGRERIFEHHSAVYGVPISILRLTYAIEMRYGVFVDVAWKVLRGETVDLSVSHLCAIWQGDANAMALESLILAATPPTLVNLTGPEVLSVREIALAFGAIFNRSVTFSGDESGLGLISNTRKQRSLFSSPLVPVNTLIEWTADWVQRNGESLNRPTHFENVNGRY